MKVQPQWQCKAMPIFKEACHLDLDSAVLLFISGRNSGRHSVSLLVISYGFLSQFCLLVLSQLSFSKLILKSYCRSFQYFVLFFKDSH